jgi:cytosine/adenosine deaminase-related metal-dependent hydrolase
MAKTTISFVNAQVLGPDGVMASSLRVAGGRIDVLDAAPAPGDLIVDLDGALIMPGLINAHDHLELNNFPRLKWRERYANARDWIADFQPRFDTDPAITVPRAAPLPDRLLIGGIKNLLSGVTTVCHHNPLYAPLRRGFPIRVVRRFRFSHSFLIDGDATASEFRRTPRDWPWIIHLAEGTDAEAAGELERLERLGCLASNTVIVHGVGLTPADRRKLAERRARLIWCPSSNQFTLGATADVRELARAGRVALGSDSRLSGEGDLLDELRAARSTGQVSPAALFRMVTMDAATVLRLPHAGRIAAGFPADLTLFPPGDGDPLERLLRARRSDIRLVMIAGRPLAGDVDLDPVFTATRVPSTAVRVDGRPKWLARAIADRLRRSRVAEPGLEFGW